ncbi:hypothetical protein GW17_00059304 [Ensete ventricosum]|nr:hypothetical protein GW17_00059304 [Ensete ventricosum]
METNGGMTPRAANKRFRRGSPAANRRHLRHLALSKEHPILTPLPIAALKSCSATATAFINRISRPPKHDLVWPKSTMDTVRRSSIHSSVGQHIGKL